MDKNIKDLVPKHIDAKDAADIYVALWDGLRNRNIPCDDWQFSDLFQEILHCHHQDASRTLEMISLYLDDIKTEYERKGGNLPYGAYRKR